MKKIFKGKLLNTETAKFLGYYDNGYMANDFSYASESLYITRTGVYFIHGQGGPLSRFASQKGNDTCGGEEITVVSLDSAKKWAEENLTADEYIAIFGEPTELELSDI